MHASVVVYKHAVLCFSRFGFSIKHTEPTLTNKWFLVQQAIDKVVKLPNYVG